MQRYSPYHIALAGTHTLTEGDCLLHSVTINTTANGTITIYDSATATGKIIAVIKASVAEQTLFYDVNLLNGLTIVTAAASDITVSYT